MSRFRLVFMAVILLSVSARLVAQEKIRVACVGNSITEGYGLRNPHHDAYPAVLQRLLGDGYEVRNFGKSGRALLSHSDAPYVKESVYRDALDFNPDIVTIKLGTNDTKPQNWKYGSEFVADLTALVNSFRNLPSRPAIYLCYPVPAAREVWGINDSIIVAGVIPAIRKVAKKQHLKIIDLHAAFMPYCHLLPDGIHPDADGAEVIAHTIGEFLLKEQK